MAASKTILVLPGDGIGPEVVTEMRRLVDWLGRDRGIRFEVKDGLVGGCSIDKYGVPLTDETMAAALKADAVLLGAVGGPAWDGIDFAIRPEAGLLRLRKEMELFANLRPAIVFPALADASTLKREIVEGLDIMIVRELTGGVYFGEPRGIEEIGPGERRGVNTQVYTTSEVKRVGRVAFELARQRSGKLCSVEKSNVMESGLMWRQDMTALHAAEFSDVALSHMLADNCAMQLVRNPKQFDVIVTDNLFGDMLSDEAAMLTGSLGMLPSASFGATDANGMRRTLYEPVHGSAPDIAGQGLANPIATLLSFSMMLRYSFGLDEVAGQIEAAIHTVLNSGIRTADIMSDGKARVSTGVMGDTILRELGKLTD